MPKATDSAMPEIQTGTVETFLKKLQNHPAVNSASWNVALCDISALL